VCKIVLLRGGETFSEQHNVEGPISRRIAENLGHVEDRAIRGRHESSFRSRVGSQWKTGEIGHLWLRREWARGSTQRLWCADLAGCDLHYRHVISVGGHGHNHGERALWSGDINPEDWLARLFRKHLSAAGKGVSRGNPDEGSLPVVPA
jgi:hypothetical protein